jgi:serine/threonine protein kinase
MTTNEFIPLTRGAFGNIYLSKRTNNVYKYIHEITEFKHETHIHKEVSPHLNIVRYHGDTEDNAIIMEYTDLGNLRKWLDNITITEDLVRYIIQDIGNALKHCHSLGYIHRDVKSDNILVFSGGKRFKLCDFGLACHTSDRFRMGRMSGSPAFMAPELYINTHVSPKNDVWSLGCVMFELICGERLCMSNDRVILREYAALERFDQEKFTRFMSGNIATRVKDIIGRTCSEECIDLLCAMLEYDPSKRPSITEVLDHQWFHLTNRNVKLSLTPQSLAVFGNECL